MGRIHLSPAVSRRASSGVMRGRPGPKLWEVTCRQGPGQEDSVLGRGSLNAASGIKATGQGGGCVAAADPKSVQEEWTCTPPSFPPILLLYWLEQRGEITGQGDRRQCLTCI